MKKKINYIFLLIISGLIFCSCNETETRNFVPPAHFDFTEINSFFRNYTVDGKVKYKEVKRDKALNKYIEQVKNFEPYAIEDANERLAFWINAYNAFTIKLVSDYYPVESILDIESKAGKNPWSINFIEMADKRKFTLDEIEKEIIIPEFKEPRIHYALVCAAESCPVIIAEAYLPGKLNEQLDAQAIIFLNDKGKNFLNRTNKSLDLSIIYKWYKKDFVRKDSLVVNHILKYINQGDKEYIIANSVEDISYLDYSWKLNDYKKPN